MLTRESGRLEVPPKSPFLYNSHFFRKIYQLPNFELVFACPLVCRGPLLLSHNLEEISKEKKEHHTHQNFFMTTTAQTPDPTIIESSMHYIDKSSYPYLMIILSTGDLLIYKSFCSEFSTKNNESNAPLR